MNDIFRHFSLQYFFSTQIAAGKKGRRPKGGLPLHSCNRPFQEEYGPFFLLPFASAVVCKKAAEKKKPPLALNWNRRRVKTGQPPLGS